MLHYRKSTLIDAPVEVVWNFHERLDILERLTPPWQPVQVVRREGGLGVGAISEFRLFAMDSLKQDPRFRRSCRGSVCVAIANLM